MGLESIAMATLAVTMTITAVSLFYALFHPHPVTVVFAIVIGSAGLIAAALFAGQALQFFAAGERERHWEGQRYIRSIRP